MVLLIDHYDSFTYNLVGLLETLGQRVVVRRAGGILPEEARALCPTHLVLSPGPGQPSDYPQSAAIAELFWEQLPILGVCLGHQLLLELAGGQTVCAVAPRHGKASPIRHTGTGLFSGIAQGAAVMRYHSLVSDLAVLPRVFAPTAWSEDSQELMAVQHRWLPIAGVQFHPESILTPTGRQLVENWLEQRADFQPAKSLLTAGYGN